MLSRRKFIKQTTTLSLASGLLAGFTFPPAKRLKLGVQLYTFREEMMKDPKGTLARIAGLGIKKIESAGSSKGYYYGLGPAEMKTTCRELGMKLVSGHVRLDDHWEKTMDDASLSGQEYLICSTMPSEGQTVDNYRRVAETFNKAGEKCRERGIKFGYHNHEYEFESEQGQVLYDLLLVHTDPDLVHMELDLGWVIVAGKDPLDYFKRFPGRFPLWHLKDMDMTLKQSTEFGKGGLDIPAMMAHRKDSGVEHIFIEQEEYETSPLQSMRQNMDYMRGI